VTKHAAASRARISARASQGRLQVVVADDGVGGADVQRGSGLQGLADRVEALGGELRVESPPASGTRVEAILPISGEGDS
jgi:signal transduction histidine kinase